MRREVAPQQINTAGEAATLLAVQNGDLHVHQRIRTHLIDELTFGPVTTQPDVPPSWLLKADRGVVDFTGRTEELTRLKGWCDGGAAMAVHLIHGGAGQGKTRLAHRFAELARAEGWSTVQAWHSSDAEVRPIEVAEGSAVEIQKPLLVLLDYAERWPLSDLLAVLQDQRLYRRKVRFLLLARPLGAWWETLTYRLHEKIGVSVSRTELGVARTSPEEVLEVARSCFARVLGVTGLGPPVPAPGLGGSFLTLHMAALADVLAARHGDEPPDPAQLSAYLLSRERNHWRSMHENRRVRSTPTEMGRAVYVAALTRAMDYPSAVQVLNAVAVADGVSGAGQVLDDHGSCYPPLDQNTVLEPLYPDHLAEDFVALQTPGHTNDVFRPDPWAARVLRELLTHDPRRAATALPLVAESARRWPHLATELLLPVLSERPEAAVRAGSSTLSAIASNPMVPIEVLKAIESAFPSEPTGDQHAGIAAVTERLLRKRTDRSADPVRAAAEDLKLGWRLFESGRVPDGIELLTSAVDTARRLTADDRSAHVAQLELTLRSLGLALARSRQWARAVQILGEAVELWADTSARCTPQPEDVAVCLADLSLALSRQGQDESALATRRRAIEHLRQLVRHGERHRLTLIRVLVQQADQLRGGGRYDDALESFNQALLLLQEVGEDTGLEVEFASAWLGRARTFQSLGRLDDAAAAVSHAVALFRRMSKVNVFYDRDLAQAVQVEAVILAGRRRWVAALDAQGEAVAIHWRLARISPERHGLDCIWTLIAFARLCRDARMRSEDALAALDDAIRRAQSPRYRRVRDRLLLTARNIGADILDANGRHAEADAMRHHSGRPGPPPRDHPVPRAVAEIVRSIEGATPYAAKARLERCSDHEVSAVILAIKPSLEWFELMFASFPRSRRLTILRLLLRDRMLLANEVILGHLIRLIRDSDNDNLVRILRVATPEIAGVLLDNLSQWMAYLTTENAADARTASIVSQLGYDPRR